MPQFLTNCRQLKIMCDKIKFHAIYRNVVLIKDETKLNFKKLTELGT